MHGRRRRARPGGRAVDAEHSAGVVRRRHRRPASAAPFCERHPGERPSRRRSAAQPTDAHGVRQRRAGRGSPTDVRDVAHEYGCTFEAADGTIARAWLFAPPVTPARARHLVKAAARRPGLPRRSPRTPGFGQQSVAVVCESDGGRRRRRTRAVRRRLAELRGERARPASVDEPSAARPRRPLVRPGRRGRPRVVIRWLRKARSACLETTRDEASSWRRPSRRRGASGCRPRGSRRSRRRRPPAGCRPRSRCAGP